MQRPVSSAAPVRALAGLAALAWLAIYLPDAGRGFIKDDWAWLLRAPLAPSPWDAAWTASTGFFRPLVSLSFTANYSVLGLNPLGYGLTNVVLALACAIAIFFLARSYRVGERGALIASGIWLFTPHGMDMAVLWISGRSALLLVLFAVIACWAAARGRVLIAIAALALALLSKEDGVVVPALAAMAMFAAGRARGRDDALLALAAAVAALVMYFLMRGNSGALTPWSAPAEYRPSLDPGLLASNVLQYADRLITFPLVITLVIWLATGSRISGALNDRAQWAGLAWAAIALLPTVALPVRSSLYVLLGLVGTSIAAGSVAEGLLRRTSPARARVALIALVVIAGALVPIHRSRQHEWSDAARLSSTIVTELRTALRDVPEGAALQVQDRVDHPNLETTFGNLLPEMLKVTTGKHFELVAREPGPSIFLTPIPR